MLWVRDGGNDPFLASAKESWDGMTECRDLQGEEMTATKKALHRMRLVREEDCCGISGSDRGFNEQEGSDEWKRNSHASSRVWGKSH